MDKQKGFCLIELLSVLLILSILFSLSISGFSALLAKNQAVSVSNELLSDIYLTRNEAIKRGQRVSICPSIDKRTCSGSWSDGWIVYQAADDSVLSVRAKLPAGVNINANKKIKDYLSYISSGRARDTHFALQNGTFTITKADFVYKVIISNSGRPRIASL